MGRTVKKVGYEPKSKHLGHTPETAADGAVEALKVLEGRWKMIILFHLFAGGTLRFSQLLRAIPGVSEKMLIQQIRELERDGVVHREVYAQVPPKVEYSLTGLGQALCPALDELLLWAELRKRTNG